MLIFRIVDDESREVRVAAEGVQGFFVESEESLSEVTFFGVHYIDKGWRRSEDMVLEVVDSRQEKIGEYYVGRVLCGEADVVDLGAGGLPSVSCRHFGGRCKYPKAGEVWLRWASGIELERDEWSNWSSSYHETWLHVVQTSWFTSHRRAARYDKGEVVYLDGLKIATRSTFYCVLGEAINGPGGYFGSNLDALADCLSSEYGEAPPLKIIWRDLEMSRNSLGGGFVEAIMAIMREFHIEVVDK